MSKSVGKVVEWLSIAFSIFSIALLIKEGFDLGIAAPFQRILNWYANAIHFLLGWADEPLHDLMTFLSARFAFHFQLYPHWKHVFVLMWFYFGGDFKSYWTRSRPVSAFVTLSIGAVVALAGSVLPGSIPLQPWNALFVAAPAAGFTLYEALKSPWSATFFRRKDDTWWGTCSFYLVYYALTSAVAGALALMLGVWLGRLGYPHASMLSLVAFLLLLILRNVWMGHRYTVLVATDGGTWWQRFNKSSPARLARWLLIALAGGFIFIICGAGLALAGL